MGISDVLVKDRWSRTTVLTLDVGRPAVVPTLDERRLVVNVKRFSIVHVLNDEGDGWELRSVTTHGGSGILWSVAYPMPSVDGRRQHLANLPDWILKLAEHYQPVVVERPPVPAPPVLPWFEEPERVDQAGCVCDWCARGRAVPLGKLSNEQALLVVTGKLPLNGGLQITVWSQRSGVLKLAMTGERVAEARLLLQGHTWSIAPRQVENTPDWLVVKVVRGPLPRVE